ncbi:MAG: GAF domain-containing protein [Cyanobacteria bacterium SIG31]|nr:GAF domain-containing protein [Cyanobacteria bacterium SIG31]
MSLENFIYESAEEIFNGDFEEVKTRIIKHKEIYQDDTAICFSLLALGSFAKKRYDEYYQFMNDAQFLVENSKNCITHILYELVLAHINFTEKNSSLYSINYNKARKLAIKNQKTSFFERMTSLLKCPPITHLSTHAHLKDPLIALVKIGQAVAAEKNIDNLIRTIAEETKEALNADRCTVFLYDKENNELYSKVATGLDDEKELRIPADKGLAGHVVQTGETINIKDAYKDERFNKNIDKKTGYRTKTILCMPIKNFNQEIIGVFQVLNKFDETFTIDDEDLLVAIASSAGISLENAQLFEKQNKMIEEQKIIFDSFIETLASSIDARDKITSGHSTRVKMYAALIAHEFGMEKNDIYILEKAAALHDIGKIGIRDSVLQKEGKLTPEEYKHIQEHVEITHNILEKIHMSEDFKQITEIACSHHEKFDGTGYYRGLKGIDIPFGGRVLAVSDVFDAITSKRHYRDKMPIEKVIDIIMNGSGNHFDPLVVEKFLAIKLSEIVRVFLTENTTMELDSEDNITLEKYNLLDLYYSIVNNCSNKLLQVFNRYYVGIDLDNE